jgi:hypothetical protein
VDGLLPALWPPRAVPRPLRERFEPWRSSRPRIVGWAIAACLAARTERLRALGPFEPAALLFYEDLDLCLRARAAGVPTELRPEVRVVHHGGHATGPALGACARDLQASRRREVVGERLGARALALDDAAQALTFGARALAGRRRAENRAALRSLGRARRGSPIPMPDTDPRSGSPPRPRSSCRPGCSSRPPRPPLSTAPPPPTTERRGSPRAAAARRGRSSAPPASTRAARSARASLRSSTTTTGRRGPVLHGPRGPLPRPGVPRRRLRRGAQRAHAVEIAAKYGDGLWTLADPEQAPEIIHAWREQRSKLGRDAGEILVQSGFHLGADEQQAIASTKKWKPTQMPEVYTDDIHDPAEMVRMADEQMSDEEFAEDGFLVGDDAAEHVDRLRELLELKPTVICLQGIGDADPLGSIRRYGEEVLPALRGARV